MPRPLETPVFFTDRCLGRREVPSALRAAGATVEVHDDHFPEDLPDPKLLEAVGAQGWVFLTKDKRIRWRPMEKAALEEAGLAAFILTGGDMTGTQVARAFVTALPRMKRILTKYDRPLLARVSAGGQVTVVEGRRRGGTRNAP